MLVMAFISLLYVSVVFATVLGLPVGNFFLLQDIQKDHGKVQGNFLLKTLLIFQPTIIITLLFILSIGIWSLIWLLFPYFPSDKAKTIYVIGVILGAIGLTFLFYFINKILNYLYSHKLDDNFPLKVTALKMIKGGMLQIVGITYFAYVIVVPALMLVDDFINTPD